MSHEANEMDVRALLHRHGLRYSKPRGVILAYFRERNKHVSAERVYLDLKERGHHLSLSTVYLNLGVLKKAAMIREFSGPGGEALYDGNVTPHHHLICKRCGKVIDLPWPQGARETPAQAMRQHAERISGWQVDEPHFDLGGVCPGCSPS